MIIVEKIHLTAVAVAQAMRQCGIKADVKEHTIDTHVGPIVLLARNLALPQSYPDDTIAFLLGGVRLDDNVWQCFPVAPELIDAAGSDMPMDMGALVAAVRRVRGRRPRRRSAPT